MKTKYIVLVVLMLLLSLTGCSKKKYEIKIVIPPGTTEFVYQEDFVYSNEEISPTRNKIIIASGEGLGDSEVVLKPIKVKEENAYEPTYLTPGMPVEMDVEKGAWFKIGVAVQNPTDVPITVSVIVEGVEEIRIEEKVENYEGYPVVSELDNFDGVDTTILAKYNDVLFAKSFALIDYECKSEPVGTIDTLIPSKYVPFNNSETNQEELLNALVYDFSENSVILFYDNVFHLFERIDYLK